MFLQHPGRLPDIHAAHVYHFGFTVDYDRGLGVALGCGLGHCGLSCSESTGQGRSSQRFTDSFIGLSLTGALS